MHGLSYHVRDCASNTNVMQPAGVITSVNTLAERLKWARTQRQMSQEELAKSAGVSQGTIGNVESGERKRPRELLSIAKSLQANPDWLETGKGEWQLTVEENKPEGWGSWGTDDTPQFSRSLKDDRSAFDAPMMAARGSAKFVDRIADYLTGRPTLQPILAWEHEDDLPPGEYVMVPRLDVRLSAGAGNEQQQLEISFSENQPQAFQAAWIRQKHLKPKKLAAMTANGHSMEPSIYDGDSLLIDTSQSEVKDGNVYALWYEGGERVKRLFRLPGGGLKIKSDNPAHDTIELGASHQGHIRIIGRVVHRSGAGGL